MAGLINIGLTGLLSHQSALSTTGNNVANANTPGYSRQQAIFETQPSQFTGAGYLGTGVNIADVVRLNNEFINQQLRSDTTLNGGQSTMTAELSRLDNLFGSETTGLNRSLSEFFGALQDAAESPDAIPQRQLLISRGASLADRFQSLSARLDEQALSVEQQLGAETAKVNNLATSIAELNLAISSAPGQSQGLEPNGLLDQRDEKLRELAEVVQIQVTRQESGQVDVYIGNGQSLVSLDTANTLTLKDNPENPGEKEVFLNTSGSERRITGAISGGRLGGLLDFRDKVLGPAENALGRIAIGVASAVNDQHQKGLDLDGVQGGLFFAGINSPSAVASRVTANSNNLGNGEVAVAISDAAALTGDNYIMKFSGPDSYTVRRASDGVLVADSDADPDPDDTEALPNTMAGYGFAIALETPTGAEAGDSFRLSPTGNGAKDIAMEITAPREIALASPLRIRTEPNNTGSGQMSQGTVLNIEGDAFKVGTPDDDTLAGTLTIKFTSANEFDLTESGVTSGPFSLGPEGELFGFPGDSSAVPSVPPGAPLEYGIQYVLSGRPAIGDTFTITANDDGFAGDNRNASILADISQLGVLNGGNTTLNGSYSELVNSVGSETSRAQRGLEASATLLEQSSNLWQEQSGVNLDEEAGKLIQFQAAYNANAKVVSVARELFDTLLNSFR